MKKHKILTAVALALCIGALPIQDFLCSMPVIMANAEASETIEYNGMTFKIRDGRTDELILTSYDLVEENVTIPETIDGKTVTGIGYNAFHTNLAIKNIILPDTIDYFESCIFSGCFSLESINIPKSLRVIPNQTFQSCENLKSVDFHDNILGISESAFDFCSFELPANLKDKYISKNIGTSETFEYNDMIFAVYQGETGGLILISCNENEKNLTVPETVDGINVIGIRKCLFQGNKTIKNITLPDTVYYFGTNIFADSSLEAINIPKPLIIIPDYTFKNCTNLKSVKFHDNVLFVSKNAFENSSVVPSGINSEFTFENSVKYNYEYGYFDVKIHLDENDNYSIGLERAKIPQEEAINLILPETIYGLPVTHFSIYDSFADSVLCGYTEQGSYYSHTIRAIPPYNAQINSVEFPKYLYNISTTAFQNHTELKNIKINAENVQITSNAFQNIGIEELILQNPDSIGNNAFESCEQLKSINFNNCTGEILLGDNAFSDCGNLQSFTVSGSPETVTIYKNAFKNCTALEDITLSDTCNFVSIGNNAFENTSIKNLDINADCSIGKYAFRKLTSIETANFDGNAEILAYAFGQCENLKEVSIAGLAKLNSNAFYNCTSIENINLDTSQTIDGTAFNGCTSLMTINGEQVFDSTTNDLNPKYKDFVTESFKTATDVGFLNLYVTEQMKKIVAENTTAEMTDIQKVKALHDWVCNNTVYNSGNQEIARTYNDAAILLNDTTVCEGYARTLNLLLNAAGLESYYVHSNTHAWNVVKLGGHYFHVDSTWDDGDNISYNYFLKSDSEISAETKSHAKWTLFKPSSLHSFQGTVLPECTYQMGDMNTDGSVNVADLVMMNQYLLGKSQLSADDYILSDLNFDGRTDSFDMVKMRKLLTEQYIC